MRLFAAIALAASCGTPAPEPKQPQPDLCETIGGGAPSMCPQAARTPADASIDAPAVSQEEKLAAIQKAMNELDEAVQGCWAAAATDRFDIAGGLTMMVEIEATGAKATVVTDTARNQKLAACVTALLGAYRWAPPLYGDAIQLPFQFDAPDGQSVIDRQLVEWHGQQNTSVAVLLDENNTGNGAASMFEIAIAPRSTTQMRVTDRAEVWYFLGEAELKSKSGTKALNVDVKPGDIVYVPKGATREVIARRPDMHAVVVAVPGGREGAARAGALPTATAATGTSLPQVLTGKPYGPATIYLEPAVSKGTPLAASILALAAGAAVPEHVHTNETELLYILEGSGTMTIAGQDVAVTPTSVIQIPPNTKHAFTAAANVRAVQFYTPPGPEQRFKKKP